MKPKQNRLFLFICLITVLSSCTKTTTTVNNPLFVNEAQIENELIGLVKAENINVSGTKSTTNDKISTELEIAIINGKDIPGNVDQQKAVQKKIASSIKRNLQDPNQFDSYRVLLVKKTENNGLTKRKSTGHTFKVSEL